MCRQAIKEFLTKKWEKEQDYRHAASTHLNRNVTCMPHSAACTVRLCRHAVQQSNPVSCAAYAACILSAAAFTALAEMSGSILAAAGALTYCVHRL